MPNHGNKKKHRWFIKIKAFSFLSLIHQSLAMQALAERINSEPQDVANILRAIFQPKIYGNDFRLASEGAGLPSAAANMSVAYNAADWDGATGARLLPAMDMLLFLFCNPLRAFVMYLPNPSDATYTYQLYDRRGSATFALPLYNETPLYPRHGLPTTPFQPHGPMLFPGYDEGDNYYVHISQSDGVNGLQVTFVGTFFFNASTIIRWYAWDGKHPRLIHTEQNVVGQLTYGMNTLVIPSGGLYVFVSIYNQEPFITGATLAVTGSTAVWGHQPVSNVASLITQAYGIRVNSASIRIQNDASPLNRNGMITAVTLSNSIPWTNFATSAAALSQLQNYREFTADKGYFGVPLPDSDSDVSEFYDDIAQDSLRTGSLPQYGYPLSERRPYKAIGLSVPVFNGRSFTFDVTHTLEYLSNNKLITQETSSVSEASVRNAIVIASTQETDFENVANWREALQTVAGYVAHTNAAPYLEGTLGSNAGNMRRGRG